ncbi:MAG: hypothetical protein DRI89_03850 [Bacteroidetes bacterium]|nr:MAG: hypothetical protein DRI89_03850 [Bacteroidota bacterium]
MTAQNTDLTNDARFQQEMFEAIKDERKREIRKTLDQIHRKNSGNTRINIYSWKLQAVAAAVVILLISGGLIGDSLTNTPTNQALYTEYFSPENSLLSVRSQEFIDTKLKEGMRFYEQGKYSEAIISFQADPNNLAAKLYTGFSLMKLEKFEQAELPFMEIIENKDNLFIDQAEWNLGLCYLSGDKVSKAEQLFAKISTGNTVYNKDARNILQEMKEK